MRAIVVERTGPPDVLRVADVAAREPGPREIRIAVAACGVCFHDVVVRNGTFRRGVGMPVILGHEVAGTRREAGLGGARVSDSAISSPPRPTAMSAAIAVIAAAATRRPARSGSFSAMPGSMAAMPNSSASMPTPQLRCHQASPAKRPPSSPARSAPNSTRFAMSARVRIGERVLVTGAGGGLGLHGVQLSRLAGAFTIAVTTTAAKAARIREAGADEVIVVEAGRGFFGLRYAGSPAAAASMWSSTMSEARYSSRYAAAWPMTGASFWSGSSRANSCRSIPPNYSCAMSRSCSAKGVSRSQLADALDLVARAAASRPRSGTSIVSKTPPKRTGSWKPVFRPDGWCSRQGDRDD